MLLKNVLIKSIKTAKDFALTSLLLAMKLGFATGIASTLRHRAMANASVTTPVVTGFAMVYASPFHNHAMELACITYAHVMKVVSTRQDPAMVNAQGTDG